MSSSQKVEQWKEKMKEYRRSTSKEQLLKDLKKAGYSVKKKNK